MFSTGPPAPGDGPGAGRLGISAMARRMFDAPPDIAARPGHRTHLHRYQSDMISPYGLSMRADPAAVDPGHSYGEMSAALIEELVASDRPVDVLVLAFAIPDVRPGRATATYLSHVCPGNPFAFAICDQGAAVAFTGLRLVREYVRGGACRRALLLVVEQAALPYEPVLPADVPAGHSAVAVLLDGGAAARVGSVRQHADVAPAEAAATLTTEVTAARSDHDDVRLIVDEGLAGHLSGTAAAAVTRVAPIGRPHTGVWWELAGVLPGPVAGVDAAGGPVVLAAYDRRLRSLSLTTIHLEREPLLSRPQ